MVLTLQPEVIRGMANQRTLHGQGFFARFLYALPTSALDSREAREAYDKLLKGLLDIELPKSEFGEVEPHALAFSEEADRLLEAFRDWVEPQLAPSGEMVSFREWGSKFPGAVVRIAGVLHVAGRVEAERERPWEVPVSRDTLVQAITIGLCYLEHTRAAMNEMGADSRVEGARHLLDVLREGRVSEISKRDLFQKVRGDPLEESGPTTSNWFARRSDA
jgi:hypothetical protein